MNCKFNFGVSCDNYECVSCGWNPKVYRYRTGNEPASYGTVWERMRELYDTGLSDSEIATQMQCNRLLVKKWRETAKLEENIKTMRGKNK